MRFWSRYKKRIKWIGGAIVAIGAVAAALNEMVDFQAKVVQPHVTPPKEPEAPTKIEVQQKDSPGAVGLNQGVVNNTNVNQSGGPVTAQTSGANSPAYAVAGNLTVHNGPQHVEVTCTAEKWATYPLQLECFVFPLDPPPATPPASAEEAMARHVTELRVDLWNQSAVSMQDVTLDFQTDLYIHRITQITAVPNVTLGAAESPKGAISMVFSDQTGQKSRLNLHMPPQDTGSRIWRFQCPKILPNQEIQLVILCANRNPDENGQWPKILYGPRKNPNTLWFKGDYFTSEKGVETKYNVPTLNKKMP